MSGGGLWDFMPPTFSCVITGVCNGASAQTSFLVFSVPRMCVQRRGPASAQASGPSPRAGGGGGLESSVSPASLEEWLRGMQLEEFSEQPLSPGGKAGT